MTTVTIEVIAKNLVEKRKLAETDKDIPKFRTITSVLNELKLLSTDTSKEKLKRIIDSKKKFLEMEFDEMIEVDEAYAEVLTSKATLLADIEKLLNQ